MEALLFGAGAAVVWGFADYAAGICARRVGAVRTAFAMQSTGLVSFAVVMWILGRWPAFEPGMVPYAIALGLTGVIAVAALYRGLALGPVAVVAPVVASYVVITVILVVIFLGERLTLAQILAASLVFVGVVLTSTDARELRVTLGRPVPGVRIGLVATVGFGLWSAIFAIATRQYSWIAMVLLLRATSFVFIGAFVASRHIDLRVFRERIVLALGTTVGILDTLANGLFARGIESGYASLAATGTGMYPIVPAVLGMLALGERIAPNQIVGIVVLVIGLATLGAVS
ncbi:MAG TPA: DMT family transporter [Candidatus Bathyarchaeia archaeon]|nr:DMT family transporter [Candidatus Bathyarchaeia archaeon]